LGFGAFRALTVIHNTLFPMQRGGTRARDVLTRQEKQR
jgi:hypothetical protein